MPCWDGAYEYFWHGCRDTQILCVMVHSESGHHWLLFVCEVMEFPLSSWYVQEHCLRSTGNSNLGTIPLHTGKGVPNRLALVDNHAQPVSTQVIPWVDDAIQQFEAMGGLLLSLAPSVMTCWLTILSLLLRERQYHCAYPDFATIFHDISNGRTQLCEGGLQLFLQLMEQLAQQIPWTVSNFDL